MERPTKSPLGSALFLGLVIAGVIVAAVLIVLWLDAGGDELPYKYGGFD